MPVGQEQDTAFEWLTWCQQHGETVVDPLNQNLRMPDARSPTWESAHAGAFDAARNGTSEGRGVACPYFD